MDNVIDELESLLQLRRAERPSDSYSTELFSDADRLMRKIMEEAFEVCLELGRPAIDRQRVAEEAADLMFHLLAGLVSADVSFEDVQQVLARRRR